MELKETFKEEIAQLKENEKEKRYIEKHKKKYKGRLQEIEEEIAKI